MQSSNEILYSEADDEFRGAVRKGRSGRLTHSFAPLVSAVLCFLLWSQAIPCSGGNEILHSSHMCDTVTAGALKSSSFLAEYHLLSGLLALRGGGKSSGKVVGEKAGKKVKSEKKSRLEKEKASPDQQGKRLKGFKSKQEHKIDKPPKHVGSRASGLDRKAGREVSRKEKTRKKAQDVSLRRRTVEAISSDVDTADDEDLDRREASRRHASQDDMSESEDEESRDSEHEAVRSEESDDMDQSHEEESEDPLANGSKLKDAFVNVAGLDSDESGEGEEDDDEDNDDNDDDNDGEDDEGEHAEDDELESNSAEETPEVSADNREASSTAQTSTNGERKARAPRGKGATGLEAGGQIEGSATVHLSGVPYEASKEDVLQVVGKVCGRKTLQGLRWPNARNRNCGWGFLDFASRKAADNAIARSESDPIVMQGRTLALRHAQPKPPPPGRSTEAKGGRGEKQGEGVGKRGEGGGKRRRGRKRAGRSES